MTDKATQIIADAMRSTGCYERVNIEDHAQVIRAALAAARIAVVELPEPAPGAPAWQAPVPGSAADTEWIYPLANGDVLINGIEKMPAVAARTLAAALLAAAHTAEAQP